MPARPMRSCPRCNTAYKGVCPTCTARRMQRWTVTRDARGRTHTRGYDDPLWRRFSMEYLRLHPTCACTDCMRLPVRERDRAQIVDHIDGLGLDGPHAWDMSNMQPMSRRHHARKTAKHDGGFGNPIRRFGH